jgi:hypothetical protein
MGNSYAIYENILRQIVRFKHSFPTLHFVLLNRVRRNGEATANHETAQKFPSQPHDE